MNSTNKIRTLNDLKTPKGHLLLGNLKAFKKKDKHRKLEDWSKLYGALYTIRLGHIKALVSTDSEFNRTILTQRPEGFRRLSKINEVLLEMGVQSVFNAEGENWKRQRKIVAEALNVKKVKGFYPVINKRATQLINKIETYSDSNDSVDIIDDFISFTIDVTTEIAFGYQLDTVNKKSDSFQEHLELIFPLINERITAPLPLWRWFPNKRDRQLKDSLKSIEVIIQKCIEEAKIKVKNNPVLQEKPSNFLEALLIESSKEETVFDDKTLYGNVFAMLLAGEDTTSNTLSWTLYYLAQYPDIVSKIRTEAIDVYQNNQVPEAFNQLSQLKYTSGAIQEAIRLKPTTPMLFFQANEATIIQDLKVPKDTLIIVQNGFGQIQDEHFSKPELYDPKRWLKNECPVYQNHSPKLVRAFGGGPRLCPGMNLSLAEMTTVISGICKHFDMELAVSKTEVHENFAFTVLPENLKIRFSKVSK
ncbi:cytochrome P450 [uncultured Psychroserpens sp.]|uniref:cytochrome P450 n=1 Tax=uncultured Psychroserpens sp. TaxID=255436 RepID=UPI00262D8269|nr:cytochrome P450 [uncultured Psychroserpens sp.]